VILQIGTGENLARAHTSENAIFAALHGCRMLFANFEVHMNVVGVSVVLVSVEIALVGKDVTTSCTRDSRRLCDWNHGVNAFNLLEMIEFELRKIGVPAVELRVGIGVVTRRMCLKSGLVR